MSGGVTAKQIAEATQVSLRMVQLRSKNERWKSDRKTGRGNQPKIFKLENLPDDVRLALSVQETGLTVSGAVSDCDPAARPEALSKAALRADLVRHFESFVDRRKRGKSKRDAGDDFVSLYNTGRYLTDLYFALGKTSRQSLNRWAKKLRDNGFDCTVLVDSRGGSNQGDTSLTDHEIKTVLGLLLDQRRLKIGTAIRYAKEILAYEGIQSTSHESAFRRYIDNFKKEHADVWVLSRHGEKALKDRILPYIERDSNLLDVGAVLVADGHKCNFRVINPWTGKPVRPVLLAWMDWASRDIAGYSFVFTEDMYAIHCSLRNAILRLGKTPQAVLLDNGKAFKAKIFTNPDSIDFRQSGAAGLYARMGILTSFAAPYNARSKVIERFFSTYSDQFERLLPSFCGASITDKPARMHRNEKFMADILPDRPLTVDEAYQLMDLWLDGFYRRVPHKGLNGRCPGDVFEAGRGEGLDAAELHYLMTYEEIKSVGRNGVSFLGRHYWNDTLHGFRDKVIIKYDLSDLSFIYICDKKGRFLCRANRIEPVHPMARIAGGQSLPEIKEQIKRQRRLANQTKKVVALAARSGQLKKIDELPWTQISEADPKLIDEIDYIVAENEPDDAIPAVEPEPVDMDAVVNRRAVDPTRMFETLSGEDLDEEFANYLNGGGR